MQDRKRPNLAAEVTGIAAQRGQRLERGTEQNGQQCFLVPSNEFAQLSWQREHDVEVGNRKQEVVLSFNPLRRPLASAARTRAIPTRVVDHVPLATLDTFLDVASHRRGTTSENVVHRTNVAW